MPPPPAHNTQITTSRFDGCSIQHLCVCVCLSADLCVISRRERVLISHDVRTHLLATLCKCVSVRRLKRNQALSLTTLCASCYRRMTAQRPLERLGSIEQTRASVTAADTRFANSLVRRSVLLNDSNTHTHCDTHLCELCVRRRGEEEAQADGQEEVTHLLVSAAVFRAFAAFRFFFFVRLLPRCLVVSWHTACVWRVFCSVPVVFCSLACLLFVDSSSLNYGVARMVIVAACCSQWRLMGLCSMQTR